MDKLSQLFDWQKKFGNYCFEKKNIKDNNGEILKFETIIEEFNNKKFSANDLPNEWLRKFIECMKKELEELERYTIWKHWSSAKLGEEELHASKIKDSHKYNEKELEDIRIKMLQIELIDIFHFFMSACMCVGIDPDILFDLYLEKNKVNFDRQNKEDGYNTANKTEEDNLQIAKDFH